MTPRERTPWRIFLAMVHGWPRRLTPRDRFERAVVVALVAIFLLVASVLAYAYAKC